MDSHVREWLYIGEETGLALQDTEAKVNCTDALMSELLELKDVPESEKLRFHDLVMNSKMQVDMLIQEYDNLADEVRSRLRGIAQKCETVKKYTDKYQDKINEILEQNR